MKILETRHYKNYKFKLTLLGQWPHQSLLQKTFIRIGTMLIILSIFIPKVIRLFTSLDDIEIIIEAIPNLGLHLGSLGKYFIWTKNSDKMKKLLQHIEKDGKDIISEADELIMQKFINKVELITTAYTAIMYIFLAIFFSSPAVPKILDLIDPLNTSRDRIILYQTEYFVDPDKYYVPILMHAYFTMPVSLAVVVYFDNLLATYVHHVAAMFTILRSYLERIKLEITNFSKAGRFSDVDEIHRSIIKCVQMHEDAIDFSDTVESYCTNAFVFFTFVNLFAITINGMVTVIKFDESFSEAVRFGLFTLGTILHLFYASYQGQLLIEQSEMVLYAAYSSKWYTFPPRLRQLIMPIMIRSKPCKLTAGKVMIISMDSFSTVLKNAMSYFMVFSSLR